MATRFSSLRRSLQGQRAGGVLKDDPSPPSPNEEEERRVYHVHERLSESLAASRMLEASLVGTDAEAVHAVLLTNGWRLVVLRLRRRLATSPSPPDSVA